MSVLESVMTICDTEDYDIETEDISQNLEELTHDEIEHLKTVLNYDKSIRKTEQQRKKNVEDDIQMRITNIEMKNVDEGEVHCHTCGEKFMTFLNPKRLCDQCGIGTCKNCIRYYFYSGWTCILCMQKSLIEGKTGIWFRNVAKENKRLRRSASSIFFMSFRKLKAKYSTQTMIRSGSMQNPAYGDNNTDRYQPVYNSRNNLATSNSNPNSRSASLRRREKTAERITETETSRRGNRQVEVNVDGIDTIDNPNTSFTQQLSASNRNPDSLRRNTANKLHTSQSNLQSMSSLSPSMTTVYSETEESYKHQIAISGDVMFSVFYENSQKTLNVYIDQCRNIAVADAKKRKTDPYIKTYLLPDKTKSGKKKSTTKRSSVNPTFKETLVYNIRRDEAQKRVLSVAIWHKSSLFSYNLFLGEVQVDLSDIDLDSREPKWYSFQSKMKYPINSAFIYKGELNFELSYKSSSIKKNKGTLLVKIINAKNLILDHKHINVYVKGYLLPSRKNKQKTPTTKSDSNPNWNCLLQFQNVAFEELQDRALELWVLDRGGAFKSSEFIGGLRLNLGLGVQSNQHVTWMDAQGREKETWENFIQSNRAEITKATIQLRPNLDFY